MRILLDENLDWRLSRALPGHEVESVQKNGWAGIRNGELPARAEKEFDAFVTLDRNMQFQQNYVRLALAIVALRARSNRLGDTEPLMPKLLEILPTLAQGTLTVLE